MGFQTNEFSFEDRLLSLATEDFYHLYEIVGEVKKFLRERNLRYDWHEFACKTVLSMACSGLIEVFEENRADAEMTDGVLEKLEQKGYEVVEGRDCYFFYTPINVKDLKSVLERQENWQFPENGTRSIVIVSTKRGDRVYFNNRWQ